MQLCVEINPPRPPPPCKNKLGECKYEFCPWAANIQLNFTSLSNLALNYGTFCMQGELGTPHQRVIIGSLWSTWRLRARRKQLSLHPTLDCLSQQTPFPSPLPAFSSLRVPLHITARSWRTEPRRKPEKQVCGHVGHFPPPPGLYVVWMRQACVWSGVLPDSSFSAASESGRSCTSCRVPLVM